VEDIVIEARSCEIKPVSPGTVEVTLKDVDNIALEVFIKHNFSFSI